MRIRYWSSDVCSSDLDDNKAEARIAIAKAAGILSEDVVLAEDMLKKTRAAKARTRGKAATGRKRKPAATKTAAKSAPAKKAAKPAEKKATPKKRTGTTAKTNPKQAAKKSRPTTLERRPGTAKNPKAANPTQTHH